jgi:hypothetical protein
MAKLGTAHNDDAGSIIGVNMGLPYFPSFSEHVASLLAWLDTWGLEDPYQNDPARLLGGRVRG